MSGSELNEDKRKNQNREGDHVTAEVIFQSDIGTKRWLPVTVRDLERISAAAVC